MTAPRRLSFVLAVLVACLVLPAVAAAATPGQVLADWRADGTIDGTYTLAELRAADAQINPQEREYTFWDDAYAAAVRRLNDPDADDKPKPPPTVPPQDFDKDGDIDKTDIATAAKKTKVLRKKLAANPPEPPTAEEPDEDAVPAAKKDDDDDGGLGWLVALLFAVPAAIIGIGAWRMQRGRRGKGGGADLDGPGTSFAGDDT